MRCARRIVFDTEGDSKKRSSFRDHHYAGADRGHPKSIHFSTAVLR
jgi:hypothetical protein